MIKLRKLRVMAAVADAGSVARAAQFLNLSQPAVTRSIQSLETELGVKLFARTGRGIHCNTSGQTLARRVRRALHQLRIAESALSPPGREGFATAPLSEQASDHELSAVVNIAAHGSVSAAARKVGISQPALNRSLRMLEKRLGQDLFSRTGQGMRTTPAGDHVVRRAKLAMSEIRQGLEEIAFASGAAGTVGGRIRIGALPLTQIRLVPLALKSLLERFPAAEIAVEDGSYTSLLTALRHGDIDLLVGTIRDGNEISSMTLFEDVTALAVGADHPLAHREKVSLADCLSWDWVLPFAGVPLRVILESAIAAEGLAPPRHVIETDSMIVARTLLVEGHYVAALSPHQLHYEIEAGLLKILPVSIGQRSRPVGVTMREDFQPTPLIGMLIAELKRVAGEIA